MKLHSLKHTCIIPVLCAALLIPSYTVHADWEYNAEENTLRYKTKDGTYLTSVFRKIKGYTYYFNADGTVHTGWLDLKGDRYFFSESGAMLTSQWIGDKYLMKNGKMARSRWVDNHNVYVNKNGSRVAVGKKYKAKFIKTAQGTKYRMWMAPTLQRLGRASKDTGTTFIRPDTWQQMPSLASIPSIRAVIWSKIKS